MTRTTITFEEQDDEALPAGSYTVEVINARAWRPEDPDRTAAVFLSPEVLNGPYAGHTTDVKVNAPTDEQVKGYKDGGKMHRRSLRGMRAAFSRAAIEAVDDPHEFGVPTSSRRRWKGRCSTRSSRCRGPGSTPVDRSSARPIPPRTTRRRRRRRRRPPPP